jgi:multiple sugar transport system permease protein
MRPFAGWALVAPAVAMLGLVVLYPAVWVIWLSLHRSMPIFGVHRFVGLSNFHDLAADPQFAVALGNTVLFVVASVGLELLLALPAAVLLDGISRGRGVLRVIVLVPWAIPTVVSARMWEWIYQPDYGVLNHILKSLLGISPHWLGDPALALWSAIVMDVWKTAPFVVLILLAGLASIPGELYEAARVDGASRWQVFRHVMLPLLKPAIVVALLFRSIEAFRVFDAIYVLTGGGPAGRSETLSVYAYRALFSSMDFGYGSAAAVVAFAVVLVMSLAYMQALGWWKE